jgi:hypothetical protein
LCVTSAYTVWSSSTYRTPSSRSTRLRAASAFSLAPSSRTPMRECAARRSAPRVAFGRYPTIRRPGEAAGGPRANEGGPSAPAVALPAPAATLAPLAVPTGPESTFGAARAAAACGRAGRRAGGP